MRTYGRAGAGAAIGLALAAATFVLVGFFAARRLGIGLAAALGQIARNETRLPLRALLLTAAAIWVLAGVATALAGHYHVLGTDRTGNDVLYQALKSVRTAFVIGTLATLATLPFAVVLGVVAGYFRGWVDEVIQYLYTPLSSVPNVLLIAACVLMVQVFIDKNPDLFETGAQRADLRIFPLCVILGVTGWANLCRLLRAETMKLRELIDLSINETLNRTLGTSMTVFLASLPLALFGGSTLSGFAWVMLFGIVVGTSSSIFIAAPILLFLGENRLRRDMAAPKTAVVAP